MECIGKGGMGEVYRAHQLNLKRDVAIKVISAQMLSGSQDHPDEMKNSLVRFQREVQAMAQVHHPNVLQIFDYGSAQSHSDSNPAMPVEYIVMELVPGNTLRFTMSEEGFGSETQLLVPWLRQYYLPDTGRGPGHS